MSEEHKNGRWWTTSVSRRNILRGGIIGGRRPRGRRADRLRRRRRRGAGPGPGGGDRSPGGGDRSPGGRDRGPDGRGGEADRSANCRANGRADGAPAG